METKIDENQEGENGSKDSKRKSYPVRELSSIIEFVATVYDKLGVSVYHSREDIAKAHNLEVESIKQILSTCQQYGLLELKHGTGYKISPLFIKVHKPLNDAERVQGIMESLRSCEPFRKLIEDYNGHSVPAISGIANNLVRSLGYRENIALRVAELFVNNLRDYNFVDAKNELKLAPQVTTQKEVSGTAKIVEPIQVTEKIVTTPIVESAIVIPIPLKTPGKKAFLHLPEDYTDSDLNRISKFVNALRDDDEIK